MNALRKLEDFKPHLVYYEDTGILQVIFLDRSVDVIPVAPGFEVLVNSNPTSKDEPIVGFNLYGALDVLHGAGLYHQKTIKLSRLAEIFFKTIDAPPDDLFWVYADEVCELVCYKHNLVWKIPK